MKSVGMVSTLSLPITPEDLLKALGEVGLTNEEIASVFGITVNRFQEVLHDNPVLDDILSAAKANPNRRVEASLYRRALGFQHREVHKVEGKPVKVVIKDSLPDVLACIFWLKNRDPKRWRDTLDVTHTLRDRFDRAHQAIQSGAGIAALPNKGGNGEDETSPA
jgi:hypothetical protein